MSILPRTTLPAATLALLALLAGCTHNPKAPALSQVGEPAAARPDGTGGAREPAAASTATPAPASAADEAQPRLYRGTDRVVGASEAGKPLQGAPVELRFEDAPVREVVHAVLGDLLKLEYVIYPPLDGRITIATPGPIPPDQAAFLLEAALQANGLAMARDARGTYHVGKPDALRAIVPMVRQVGKDALPPGTGAIVVPLRYIGAAEMASILRPLAPPDAIVRVDTVRNLLVLVGSRTQAEGWLGLVATFDIDLLAGMSVGVFPLKYVSARDVEGALQLMSGGARAAAAPAAAPAAAARAPAAGAPPASAAPAAGLTENHPLFGAIRVLPIERLNAVVVVTPRAAYLDEARRWIERLDRPANAGGEPRLHVYAVRNGSAAHLGQVLSGIFGGGQGASGGATGVAPGQASVTARTAGASTARIGGGIGGGIGGAVVTQGLPAMGAATGQSTVAGAGVTAVQYDGNVRVIADEKNNAILVYGTAAQFERIEEALRRLDVPPTQVLIEASIVEVTLTDDLRYGLQWAFTNTDGGYTGTGVLSNRAGGELGGPLSGFSYVLRNSLGNVRVVLNALAEKSLVRVISTPSLMVLDNHTASIIVGNQQPILSSETVSEEGISRTQTITYKDTGVSLAVTPSVGSGDMVTMDINQAVTDVGQIDVATGQRTFLQRQIGSKVAVRSGETLVLGGLIRDNNTDGSSGLPLFHEIPILGALFGTKQSSGNRTELLVVITPRVARSDEDARAISRELRDRMQGLAVMQPADPAQEPPPAPLPPPTYPAPAPSGPSMQP
jgi:general secretion pathway protein D